MQFFLHNSHIICLILAVFDVGTSAVVNACIKYSLFTLTTLITSLISWVLGLSLSLSLIKTH